MAAAFDNSWSPAPGPGDYEGATNYMTLAHRSQNKISCRSSFGTTARRETPANEPCWLSGPLKPPRLAHPRSRSTPFVGLPWSMAVPWDGHFDSVLHARAQSPPAATEGQRAVSRAFAKQERMAVQARRARCNSPRALRQRPAQPPSSEAHGRVDHRRVTAMSEEALVASRRRAAERSRTSASSCAPRAPRQAWQDPSPLDRPLEEHDPCKSRNVSDHAWLKEKSCERLTQWLAAPVIDGTVWGDGTNGARSDAEGNDMHLTTSLGVDGGGRGGPTATARRVGLA